MASPIIFPQANLVLRAPSSEEQVRELPAYRFVDADGQPQVLSKWELSQKELDEVRRTGVMWFICFGATHPPVLLGGIDPFEADGKVAWEQR